MKIESKPILTGKELVEFMDSYDMLIHLTEPEANLLLGYLDGHGYTLEECNGELFQIDLCSDQENPERREYSIDDAIDEACEWNYDMIQKAKATRENPDNFLDYVEKVKYYHNLREDERILDQMFERTKYGKAVNELAEKLASDIIQNLEQKQEMKEAVQSVADEIIRFGTDKKGMVR